MNSPSAEQLLAWTYVKPGDRQELEAFRCAPPPRSVRVYGKRRPENVQTEPWAAEAQRIIRSRGAKFDPHDEFVLLGRHDGALVAVVRGVVVVAADHYPVLAIQVVAVAYGHHNRGYGTEAFNAALDHIAARTGANHAHVKAVTHQRNTAAQHLLETFGLTITRAAGPHSNEDEWGALVAL